MREITLSSIIVQLVKNKKITIAILIIPTILGMALGFIKGTGQSGVTPETKSSLEAKVLQYKAYEDSNTGIIQFIKDSVYLNMDPQSVPTKTYTIFVDTIGMDQLNANKSGFYYSNFRSTEEDYAAYRGILGTNLEDRFIDELTNVSYYEDTNILTVKAVHPDQAVADRLADYNYNRIMTAYQNMSEADHSLELIGQKSFTTIDSGIVTKLTTLLATVEDQRGRMVTLKPSLVQNAETDPAASPMDLFKSMIKWGILGFAGGIALAAVYALLMAPGSRQISDIREFEDYAGVEVLGFVPGNPMSSLEKLILGKTLPGGEAVSQIIAKLMLALGDKKGGELLLISDGTKTAQGVMENIRTEMPAFSVESVPSLNNKNIGRLSSVDGVLLLNALTDSDKEYLKMQAGLAKRAGKPVLGVVLTN